MLFIGYCKWLGFYASVPGSHVFEYSGSEAETASGIAGSNPADRSRGGSGSVFI